MELLERVWEGLGSGANGIGSAIERGLTSLFGSSNARYIRKLQGKVVAVNALEAKYQAKSDEQLRQQTADFRKRLEAGETLDDLLVEAFAVCREGGRRFLNMRHYDVQLVGGMILHGGNIAEMVTGEGKTLVATLPAYLNALSGKGVHVITVNDYLARRDMEWMGPLYMGLGLTVGAIQNDMPANERQKAYACDITYGTNNEFGFDYLRDNMRPAARGDDRYPKDYQQCQGPLNFAIIDEVDNILIDEARTPLIISGPAHDDVSRYARADKISRQLVRDQHFEVKEKEHSVHLTESGVRLAEQLAGVESFYTAGNMEWPHLIDNSLKAHHLYKRDVNYVVNHDKDGGEVVIVDEFTGRLMPGRNWSDGLHQAVEAKENVRIKQENQTLATITLQNFFKLYNKLCGMTGTAMTEANEFWKIYKLDVVAVPTNRNMLRINHADVIYRTEKEKFQAIADEIEFVHKFDVIELKDGNRIAGELESETESALTIVPREKKAREVIERSRVTSVHKKGRPVLVGTVSIEKSERLSSMLDKRGVPHQVLNAKHHKREAEIISQAGRLNAVTIATNMAGRGTDIILGGNPETMAWAQLQDKYPTRLEVPPEEWNGLVEQIEQREHMKSQGREVATLGGLHVIGSERHEARRIDLQLRGRCGRQGDPGSSRFFLSLEDDLMRIFAGEWVKNVLTRLGMQEGEAIESRMVSRRIEGAQKKVEERNFEVRKSLLEYDEVMDQQRKRVYGYRQSILDGENCRGLLLDMIDRQIDQFLDRFLDKDYGAETFAKWAGSRLVCELDASDFRGLDFATADTFAKDQAERLADTAIYDAIEENLPQGEDQSEWNWEALAKFVNTRWNPNLRDRDLKKEGRDHVGELLIKQSREAIAAIDLSEGARVLEEDFGRQSTVGWVQYKFGLVISLDELKDKEPEAIKAFVRKQARAVYDQREAELPVLSALAHFAGRDSADRRPLDREALLRWAQDRLGATLTLEDLGSKSQDELYALLLEASRSHQAQASRTRTEIDERVHKLFAGGGHGGNGALTSLSDWMHDKLQLDIPRGELERLDEPGLRKRLLSAYDDRFRPEMQQMERDVLLRLLDDAWKNHLLSMDHLKSSVGLRGYAQLDAKVEYKREGMRQFETMWNGVAERATDLVFRMEQGEPEAPRPSNLANARAVHEEARPVTEIAKQQKAAIEATQSDQKSEPIRNRATKVGRNDPCPCGSGKKYKVCCMRKGEAV
jgi:preprotein translocase subunit SecA